MRRWPLTLVLTALGLPAAAQPVMRSAEHPEYSRIVVPVSQGVDWSITQSGKAVQLSVSDAPDGYDTSGLFDRMPRTRIQGVFVRPGPQQTMIDIQLSCDCVAQAKPIGSAFIAVDIRRPVAGASPATRMSLRNPAVETTVADPPLDPLPIAPMPAAGGIQLPESPGTETGPALRAHSGDPDVQPARAALVARLEAASLQGLVTLPEIHTAESRNAEGAGQAEAGHDAAPSAATGVPQDNSHGEASPEPAVRRPPSAHIEIRSPFAADPRPEEAVPQEHDGACTGADQMAIADWGIPREATMDMLGALRRNLIDANGGPDTDGIIRLAQRYISMGFGREAIELLDHPAARPDAAILSELARLVDGLPVAPESALEAMAGCGRHATLWRAVAGLDPLVDAEPAMAELLAALEDLPPMLRQLIGQELVGRAIASGEATAARRILGLLERTPGAEADKALENHAALLLLEGRPEAALALGPRLLRRGHADPDILTLMAHVSLSAEDPALDDLPALLQAAARQSPDRGKTQELSILRAKLLSQRGDPERALSQLREVVRASEHGAGPAIAEMGRILQALATDPIEPARFARILASHADQAETASASKAGRIALARRLTDTGLPNLARRVLDMDGALPDGETRLVVAEAMLSSGLETRALQSLGDLKGEDAAKVRADAYLLSGQIDRASEALVDLPAEASSRRRVSFLAGDLEAGLGRTSGSSGGPADRTEPGRDPAGPDDPNSRKPPASPAELASAALSVSRDLRDRIESFSTN